MPTARRLIALLTVVCSVPMAAQDTRPVAPYNPTLNFGTGLVQIPTAWVSPANGDLFVSMAMRAIGDGSYVPRAENSRWDFTESLEAHLGGRVSVGLSLYSLSNLSMGAFAQVLLVRQPDFGARWLPSISIGALNVGTSRYVDRFVTGTVRASDAIPGSGGRVAIDGSPTFYGVMTRDFRFERNSASITVGYGNGLFANSGGMDTVYNKSGTVAKGLFFGGRFVMPTGDNSMLSLLVDNNGFDFSAGAEFTLGHLTAGIFMTELEEKSGVPANHALANYQKPAIKIGYSASIPDIVRGSQQRSEAAEAQLEVRRLRQEIAQREVRSQELRDQLARAKQSADKSAADEQARLLKQLDAEREAMQKAAERLQKLQKPSGKPPASPEER
ncbi:MAG: DUF4200 domain-containing protein [Gemmatimonadetes bacterium]|nr:DUF4200 domain-containing protein [Gemmatimonadota bacterium]